MTGIMIKMSKKTDYFISEITNGCQSLWTLYGILPSVACAQAALESGWGTSILAVKFNNLFGIKGLYNGISISLPTTEYYDGVTPVKIVDNFRVYQNWNMSILDYGFFISNNKRYESALYLTSYVNQIRIIHEAGYATDPLYASKVISIIEDYALTCLDILENNIVFFKAPQYSGNSIVDALKLSGVENPNFEYRATIALVNNLVASETDYVGSVNQNLEMLRILLLGKLKKSNKANF